MTKIHICIVIVKGVFQNLTDMTIKKMFYTNEMAIFLYGNGR